MTTIPIAKVPVRRGDPITTEAVADAQKIAERLHDGTRSLFANLPSDSWTATGLSRYSGIDRTSCQRFVAAAFHGPVNAEMLTRIPSPKTIVALADAILANGIPQAEALRSAAFQLEDFFLRVGGSQRAFTKLLHKGASPALVDEHELSTTSPFAHEVDVADANLRRRMQLHRLSKETVKSWCDVSSQVSIYVPSAESPGKMDIARARGVVGYQSTPGAVPLVMSYFRSISRGEQMPDPNGPVPQFAEFDHKEFIQNDQFRFLRPFCSEPMPNIATRTIDRTITYIVDHAQGESHAPFDLFLTNYSRGVLRLPSLSQLRFDEVWVFINYPTQALVFDVYLHRSLAMACIAGLDLHMTTQPLHDALKQDRWATRLPISADLILLGKGLGKAASKLYPRQAELATDLFRRSGLDPDEFVGFRCEQEYPEWRLSYRMFFDYGE